MYGLELACFRKPQGSCWGIGTIGQVMVKTGQVATIRQLAYQPVGGDVGAVETMTFQRLRELNDGGTQRADFHVLALIDKGAGTVAVDFENHHLCERSIVWIRPGAVHRWSDISELVGDLVLFTPTAPTTDTTRELAATPHLAAVWTAHHAEWPFVDAARRHLLLETRHAGTPVPELAELLLSALITRLRPSLRPPATTSRPFGLFRASVEANYRRHHDVGWYARHLGYSPRTLSRATLEATGRTAKGFIVDRLVLEAQRLLAHERLTAAACAARLGFLDASNFSVFFRNATGSPPAAWQAAMAAQASPAVGET